MSKLTTDLLPLLIPVLIVRDVELKCVSLRLPQTKPVIIAKTRRRACVKAREIRELVSIFSVVWE